MKKLIFNQQGQIFRFLFSVLIFASYFNIESAQGFESITYLNSFSVSDNTGEKPQSKVWTHDGIWWAALPNSSGTHLWRLDGTSWTNVLTLSSATNTHADCKVDGDVTHILLYSGTSSELVSIEYLPGSNIYQLWSTQPNIVSISLDSGVETATIDIDGAGRMWLASDASSDINVRWSDSPYSTWSSPITIASGIGSDDICCVAAFDGKIGVLWSNQNTDRFGFKYHVEGTDPNTWSTDEVPASQSAQSVGGGMADDHLNMAIASDGTIYAAVKTSYDTGGYPKIALLVRRPAGTWDDLYEVDQSGTRGIVLLNETSGKIVVIYTSSEGNNDIIYKESLISGVSFGSSAILISGSNNNATSTKQNYNDEFVAFASDESNAASVLVSETVIAEDIVGHWAMEENDGVTILTDSSTFTNDGTVTGSLVRELGQRAYGQDFDGSNDYVLVPDDASLDLTDEITLAVWIKPTKVGTQRIIRKLNTTTNNGYSLFLSANNYFSIRFNGSNSLRVNTSALYSSYLNQWIHIAVTYDGTTIRTYFNGNPDNTLTIPFTIGTNDVDLCLGARAEDGGDKFEGGMDDARIYNYALSPTEILSLQSTWDPPNPDNLVGHWKMDEGSGTTLIDATTYNNDASIVGNPTWVTGKDNLAIHLNGSTDYALVTDNSSLDITTAITLAVWLKPEKTATQYILKKAVINNTDGYELSLSSPGKVFVRFNQFSSLNSYRLDSQTSYPVSGNDWMHVAATYDGAMIRIYINGIKEDSLSASFSIAINSLPLAIGSDSYGVTKFQGALDDARIYNRALSLEEIQNLAGYVPPFVYDPGFALDFDGSIDYVDCGNLPSVSITGYQITLESWIKPTKQGTMSIIKKCDAIGDGKGYELYCGSGGKVFCRINGYDGSRAISTTSYPIDGNSWMHVAGTYDGSFTRMYINGVLEDETSYSVAIVNSSNILEIANDPSTALKLFKGSIDEVRIWNDVRTVTEIRENMCRELVDPEAETNLVAYYRFNEGSGTATSDLSSNINNGTLMNDPIWISSTAPVPYYTAQDGNWDANGTWATDQQAPTKDWSRVAINHTINVNLVETVEETTINPPGALTVNSGNTLTINGDFSIKSDTTGMGSFIDLGTITVGGTTSIEQYITSERWHLVSPPVSGATINTYFDIYLKEWNEPFNSWTYLVTPTTLPMNTTQGYSAWPSDGYTGTTTVTFSGVLNTGDYSIPSLSYTPASPVVGWNLLGNPYPSTLQWNSSWTKTDIGDWACVHSNGNDQCYNASTSTGWPNAEDMANGNIPSTQGFWVRATSASASLTIPQSQRINSGQAFYKDVNVEVEDAVRLRVDGNDDFDVVLVQFIPDATPGFDAKYDLEKRWGYEESPQIYAIIDGDNLFSVDVLPDVHTELVIPIGFEVGIAGLNTINVTEMFGFEETDENIFVILEDIKEGIFTELTQGSSYKFFADPIDDKHRFNLHFKDSWYGIEDQAYSGINIYAHEQMVYIRLHNTETGQAVIFDALGQEIIRKSVQNTGLTKIPVNAGTGYYLVKYQSDEILVTKKVFIN